MSSDLNPTTKWISQEHLSLAPVLVLAAFVRIALVLYARYHDDIALSLGQPKYTDVDYQVFTDAAANMVTNVSPYFPSTELLRKSATRYRYSPIIAYLLQPNLTWDADFGKWLFCVCDMVGGVVVYFLVKGTHKVLTGEEEGGEGTEEVV